MRELARTEQEVEVLGRKGERALLSCFAFAHGRRRGRSSGLLRGPVDTTRVDGSEYRSLSLSCTTRFKTRKLFFARRRQTFRVAQSKTRECIDHNESGEQDAEVIGIRSNFARADDNRPPFDYTIHQHMASRRMGIKRTHLSHTKIYSHEHEESKSFCKTKTYRLVRFSLPKQTKSYKASLGPQSQPCVSSARAPQGHQHHRPKSSQRPRSCASSTFSLSSRRGI